MEPPSDPRSTTPAVDFPSRTPRFLPIPELQLRIKTTAGELAHTGLNQQCLLNRHGGETHVLASTGAKSNDAAVVAGQDLLRGGGGRHLEQAKSKGNRSNPPFLAAMRRSLEILFTARIHQKQKFGFRHHDEVSLYSPLTTSSRRHPTPLPSSTSLELLRLPKKL
ncbi:hypothetical protein BHE74_00007677 [Ensete ventricosum]|nr:hypothetical protein BHE74_00007677 [Ensete ventricosum]